jgi:hypothetical protein
MCKKSAKADQAKIREILHGTSLAAVFCSNRGHASFLFILYVLRLRQSKNAHRLAKGN